MSQIQRGDGRYHYSDSSHRWIAPEGQDQAQWEKEILTHLARHREDPRYTIPRPPRNMRP